MATRTKKVNQWYMKYAEKEMLVDMDDQGLYCDVPSETTEGKFHSVHVDETTVVPVATHCTCSCFEHKGDCKHCTIVNSFYARIYKSNLEKFVAKFEEQEIAEVAPEIVEQIVEQVPPIAMELPAELKGYKKTAVSSDLKGNLNGAQQSAAFLMALPSRKARAS